MKYEIPSLSKTLSESKEEELALDNILNVENVVIEEMLETSQGD